MAPVWGHTFSHGPPVGCLGVTSRMAVPAVRGCRAGDTLLLQVLLEAGEHSHAVPGMAGTRSCDGEAAGTCMSVVVTQAYGTRLEVS